MAVEERAEALKHELVLVEKTRARERSALEEERAKTTRRTRWAIGATVVAFVLGGALGAGIYVAAKN